jgi:hypothetical protein
MNERLSAKKLNALTNAQFHRGTCPLNPYILRRLQMRLLDRNDVLMLTLFGELFARDCSLS